MSSVMVHAALYALPKEQRMILSGRIGSIPMTSVLPLARTAAQRRYNNPTMREHSRISPPVYHSCSTVVVHLFDSEKTPGSIPGRNTYSIYFFYFIQEMRQHIAHK